MSKDFADLYLYEEMRSSLAITQKTFLAQNNHDSSNSHAKNTIFNIKILKISIARCNSNFTEFIIISPNKNKKN